jgi:hypothetical protein
MMSTQLSERIVNGQAAIVADLLRDGFLDLYDGVQPDSPEVGVVNQVFLGSVRFTGFTEPNGGLIYAFPITGGVAIESGSATWARLYRSDHRTPVMDVSVGETDADCIVRSSKVERGTLIEFEAFEYQVPKSAPGI